MPSVFLDRRRLGSAELLSFLDIEPLVIFSKADLSAELYFLESRRCFLDMFERMSRNLGWKPDESLFDFSTAEEFARISLRIDEGHRRDPLKFADLA